MSFTLQHQWHTQSWQTQIRAANLSIVELCEYLQLDPEGLGIDLAPTFRLKVPPQYLEKIEKRNAQDPLLLQVLPLLAESKQHPGYSDDPLDEQQQSPVPGLIHKFYNRVLLPVTGHCPIHCRYCFRRHFPYSEHVKGHQNLSAILDYLEAHPWVNEVILSGGDPLAMSDDRLFGWFEVLGAIKTIKTIRLHSRMAVTIPERLKIDWSSLVLHGAKVVLVTHCNHPNELGGKLRDYVLQAKQAGIVVLNQTVMLKGINDNAATQIQLANKLFDYHILPYYLHQLDSVSGSQHFAVPLAEIHRIYENMRNHLSGYCLPKLVKEVPGRGAKVPLA